MLPFYHMAVTQHETPAETSAHYASECWESHERLLDNARTCEPKMFFYWLRLAMMLRLNAERYEEHAKDDAELDRLLKLHRVHPHDKSIMAELRNRPTKERVNAIIEEMVRVSKWNVM